MKQTLKQSSIKSIGFWKEARMTFREIFMVIYLSSIKRSNQ
jgi:hypothetical protein